MMGLDFHSCNMELKLSVLLQDCSWSRKHLALSLNPSNKKMLK